MSRFFDLVSKPARDMGGYLPMLPQSASPVQTRLIALDSNENPYGPSPSPVKAVQSALASSNLYPEDDCTQLRRKLGERKEISVEQALVTAGSTALLGHPYQACRAPG